MDTGAELGIVALVCLILGCLLGAYVASYGDLADQGRCLMNVKQAQLEKYSTNTIAGARVYCKMLVEDDWSGTGD